MNEPIIIEEQKKEITKAGKPSSNPIPDTLENVPGFPETLKIYRVPCSSYYYMRTWMDGKMVTRSTKTKNKELAKKTAGDFYNELLLKRTKGEPLTNGKKRDEIRGVKYEGSKTKRKYQTKLLEQQSNKCQGCNKQFKESKDTCVDHCHTTMKVRGILCRKCNLLLGYANDNPNTLINLVLYLAKNGITHA